MRIGLIDVDGTRFPNIPLMKLSAWHKQKGDHVEWYQPLFSGHMDIVYMSKVFSWTPDYEYFIDAEKIVRGGTGYCISVTDGKEVFDESKNTPLPDEVEHIYPDYEIYYDKLPQVKETAYGFLTRGCPRGCDFCIVAPKEGRCSVKVADLSEFWRGQKYINLSDPNFFACKDWRELAQQLIDSKAWINFNQGCDIRLMDEEKAKVVTQMKIKNIDFAWDNYKDKDIVIPRFKMFKEVTGYDHRKMLVFCLTNYNSTFEEDLFRINTLRELGYSPYVTIYNKTSLPKHHQLRKLQRWVNNRFVWEKCKTWEEYQSK